MLKAVYSVCFSIPLAELTPHPRKILHSNDSSLVLYCWDSESYINLTNCDLQLACLLSGKCTSELFETVAVFLIHLFWITVILDLKE